MFRASLCPSSGDRLNRTASGVSLDVLAAVEYLHSRSALSSCPDYTLLQASMSRLTPDAVLFSLSPDDGHNDARNMLS